MAEKPTYVCSKCGSTFKWSPVKDRSICKDCCEVEVNILWDLSKMDAAQRALFFEITRALPLLGVSFDTGSDGKGFDWEWDWSLRGPVKVHFRRFTSDNPKNRYVRERDRRPVDPGEKRAAMQTVQRLCSLIEQEETN